MSIDQPDPHSDKPGSPIGVGAPIAILIVGGVIVGGLLGQPSIGLLAGVVLGIAVALIAWRAGTRK
ncbi:hypothetical protein LWE61_05910 [Sphingobium sufflavum]|nr:hypothetical protein [Sphingobium sufflavum]MCE7796096.1 hypothetical protein [Sphingobium sufflavum]